MLLGLVIIFLAMCGIGFMTNCIRRDRLTDRNLVIGGSLVIVNFVLLVALFVL